MNLFARLFWLVTNLFDNFIYPSNSLLLSTVSILCLLCYCVSFFWPIACKPLILANGS